jgi:hypothetical protein
MTYVSPIQPGQAADRAWPAIPEGMNGVQIVAIARMVERICGTAAAASYLAEAVAAFEKKARSVHTNYLAKYSVHPLSTELSNMPADLRST